MRRLLTPAARADRRAEVRHYRDIAGTAVAARFIAALESALQQLERQPGIGSPLLGESLGIQGLKTWRVAGFALRVWCFERTGHLLVVRFIGERQDPENVEIED